jgi:hypothetical protein
VRIRFQVSVTEINGTRKGWQGVFWAGLMVAPMCES